MELRPHQISGVGKLRLSIAGGKRRPILFAPCSFGKTICAAYVAKCAEDKFNKTLFLVHRRLLAEQTKEKFDQFGLKSSIIMAGYETDFSANIMITTHQTYSRRIMLDDPDVNKFFHDAACLIVDECHFGISESYKKIYKYYEDKVIIGLTGSPARADQRGLGEIFDDIVETVGIKELTDMGFLTPARYYAPSTVDMKGVKIKCGDYDKTEADKRFNNKKIIGDVLENWLAKAEGRKTIVFSTSVKHSIAIKEAFLSSGISAEHLDANSTDEERQEVLYNFRYGDLKVVTNCQLFTEGYDADFVGCIVLARATKSFPLYVQMVGRGQRIFPGKEDFFVFDHGGNIDRHGFISDPVTWSLDGKELAWKKPKKVKKEKKPVTCTACKLIFQGNICPDCGTEVKSYGKDVETIDAELEEVDPKKKKMTMADKRRWWGMCKHYQKQKGYSDGWAAHKYRSKTGVWPRGMDDVLPITPDIEFMNRIKYEQIRYAKRKQKELEAQK